MPFTSQQTTDAVQIQSLQPHKQENDAPNLILHAMDDVATFPLTAALSLMSPTCSSTLQVDTVTAWN